MSHVFGRSARIRWADPGIPDSTRIRASRMILVAVAPPRDESARAGSPRDASGTPSKTWGTPATRFITWGSPTTRIITWGTPPREQIYHDQMHDVWDPSEQIHHVGGAPRPDSSPGDPREQIHHVGGAPRPDSSRGDPREQMLHVGGMAGRRRWAGSRDGEYVSRRGGYESVRGAGEAAEGGGEAAEGREGRPVGGEAGMRGTGGGEAIYHAHMFNLRFSFSAFSVDSQ